MRRSSSSLPTSRLAAALLLSTAPIFTAHAQDRSEKSTTLDRLVVEGDSISASPVGPDDGFVADNSATATKTNTPIDRVPQSISVVTRDQMDMQGADSVGAAVRYTPGIRSEAYGADTRYDWFFMRGFSAQARGLYLDGLQLRSQAFANFRVESYGLERQEVLLGPSSALFGAGSPGGLINLISKRPQEDTFYRASVAGGWPKKGEVALDLNAALPGHDGVYARFTALGRLGETQVDHVDDNRLYLAPSITFKPQAGTELTIMGKFQMDRTGTVTSFLPYDATVRPASFGRIPTDFFSADTNFDRYDRNQMMLGYEFEHEFENGLKFSQDSRYSYISTEYETLYGVGLVSSYLPGYPDNLLARQALATDDSIGAFQTDNRIEKTFDMGPVSHQLLAGLDYRYEVFDNRSGYGDDPSGNFYIIDILNPVYGINVQRPAYSTDSTTRSHRVGLYVQDQIALTDRLDVTAGLRHDWVSSRFDNHLTGSRTDRDDTALTGRIGASYEVLPGLRPYASYATSFDPLSGTDINGNPFDPETAEQYEVGVKYQDPLDRFRLTAAWFDLTRENVLTNDPANPNFKVQTGEVRSRGIELQAQANLAERWDIVASYTNYDLEITRSNNGDQGMVPIGVPQQMASLWVNHRFGGQLEGLRVGAGVRYVGKSYANAANTLTVPDYVVADASIGYRFDKTELSLNVSNLFDKHYVAACAGQNACYYGDRRNVKARLTFEW